MMNIELSPQAVRRQAYNNKHIRLSLQNSAEKLSSSQMVHIRRRIIIRLLAGTVSDNL